MTTNKTARTQSVKKHIAELRDPSVSKRYLAAIKLGKSKHPSIVPALITALRDSFNDTYIDYCLCRFYRMCPSKTYAGEMTGSKYSHLNEQAMLRQVIIEALGKKKDRRSASALANVAVSDPVYWIRWNAVRALGDLGFTDSLGVLEAVRNNDKHPHNRTEASEAIGKILWKWSAKAFLNFCKSVLSFTD